MNRFESANEVPSILTTIVGRSTTIEQIEKVQTFAKENTLDTNKNLRTALKNAHFNLKWAEHNVPIIKCYLESIKDSAMTHNISCFIFLGLVFVTIFNY